MVVRVSRDDMTRTLALIAFFTAVVAIGIIVGHVLP
jgi:hypothetical protein